MAEQLTIEAEKREALGTRVARRYRKEGKVPAVLAHKGDQPVNLLVNRRDFDRIVKKRARIINLSHPAGKDKVFIREVQYDHLDENPIHIDFTKVAMDEMLQLEVPLRLKGKPVGVTEEGAVLDQFVKILKIECLPDAIPDVIEVDVTHLKKDEKLSVKDVPATRGVKIIADAEQMLAIVQEHKVEEVLPAAAAPGPLEPEIIKKEVPEGEAAEGAPEKEKEKGKEKEKEKKEKKEKKE